MSATTSPDETDGRKLYRMLAEAEAAFSTRRRRTARLMRPLPPITVPK